MSCTGFSRQGLHRHLLTTTTPPPQPGQHRDWLGVVPGGHPESINQHNAFVVNTKGALLPLLSSAQSSSTSALQSEMCFTIRRNGSSSKWWIACDNLFSSQWNRFASSHWKSSMILPFLPSSSFSLSIQCSKSRYHHPLFEGSKNTPKDFLTMPRLSIYFLLSFFHLFLSQMYDISHWEERKGLWLLWFMAVQPTRSEGS